MATTHDTHDARRPLLTAEGRAKLEAELNELIEVQRPQIANEIHDAKEGGDISESGAYEHAKNEQARIEGRIRELTELLNRAGTLELTSDSQLVHIGSTVEIETQEGARRTFTIVSTYEADPNRNFISNESPVGNAMLNKRKGDFVLVKTPRGEVPYTIVAIH